jgi:uncharacterized protein with FMN-binding domain
LKRRKQAVPKRSATPLDVSTSGAAGASGEGGVSRGAMGASGKRMSNSLIALGSAAIVAVYAAGYQRTRAAAQGFSDEDARRRPPAHAAATQPAAAPPIASAASARALGATDKTAEPDSVARAANTESRPDPGAEVAHAPNEPELPASAPPVKRVAAAPVVTSVAKAADHVAQSGAPASSTAAPATNAAASAAKVAVPAEKAGFPAATKSAVVTPPGSLSKATTSVDTARAAAPGTPSVVVAVDTPKSVGIPDSAQATDSLATVPSLRDGTYTGWGTSRHGDIQAAVVIEGGRIVRASIVQCLTRYSCSWIAALPPQVVSRQSPEVDYVSGATQSTNAFYYAIVEALSKAR